MISLSGRSEGSHYDDDDDGDDDGDDEYDDDKANDDEPLKQNGDDKFIHSAALIEIT